MTLKLSDDELLDFIKLLVKRGLGLYGQDEMAKICYNSGIALTDQMEIDWLNDDHEGSVQKLLVSYGSRNLPAKMTAILLARKHQIPVPEALTSRSKKRRRFFKFRRNKS
ncbi:MAG: hypothetical protein ACTSVI_03170 [Promethearchaeota archaeon]